jgi:hypothetical protein
MKKRHPVHPIRDRRGHHLGQALPEAGRPAVVHLARLLAVCLAPMR